jgi:hypothetical protein
VSRRDWLRKTEEIAKASHRPGARLLETMRERIPESWRYLPSMDDQKQVD